MTVDVVIPVYNAPLLTRRCIDSVVKHLGSSISKIFIQDDASNPETCNMLDSLVYPRLHVFHAPENQGYGKSVNDAVARSDADLVLVLNSDTEVFDDFLSVLCSAFVADPKLAVISPAENDFPCTKADRYMRQAGGYIVTYRFRGYAFLVRRAVFNTMGGFDAQFGRGYYEDTDFGRRLEQQGWRMGVHPDVAIRHETGVSFGRGQAYHDLVRKNRALYYSRYPLARQNILVVSGSFNPADLPVSLANTFEQVMRQGGRLHWLTPVLLPHLSCLQMRNSVIGFAMILKMMLRGWSREDKRINAVWILPGVSVGLRAFLIVWVRIRQLKVNKWGTVAL